MIEPLAFSNGRFVPASALSVPIYDAGFVLGTTVAEQVRSFGGRLFRLERHLERLWRSLDVVRVDPGLSRADFAKTANDLVARNHALLDPADDLGLGIFVTPGPYATFAPPDAAGPTVCLHTYPLPFHRFAHLYQQGDALVVTNVRQVSADCWPRSLKCRSRMHYYLADHQARQKDPHSRAVLLDEDGFVTETTTASLVVVEPGPTIVSPPHEKLLPGISVAVLAELAEQLGIPFVERDLTPADVAAAEEVLLAGTTPCLLPVLRLNGEPICSGRPGDVFHRLIAAWSALVDLDIVQQAQRFAKR
jgi:branched-subunit amino acid aminotransferase/4-amino-4-deoxychorismate lyase